MKTRHRGKYDPTNENPYELSRSKVENFLKCEACFWLERVKGVHFPGIPQFNLNTNTDTLLKRDFNKYRGKGPHPFMVDNGLKDLRPFQHEDMIFWERSMQFGLNDHHFNVIHLPTNIRFGGGLDDAWENIKTGKLHIVDYKSTANLAADPQPVNLEGNWKKPYKRQMDMYQWVMRRKGFEVDDLGYFLYVDGQHKDIEGMIEQDTSKAKMIFNTSLLTYEGDDSWVEEALFEIKDCLNKTICPDHAVTGFGASGDKPCEFGHMFQEMKVNGIQL
tara:strand:- start:19 stop:843 length:825 start_codon:yes stop_codon:yes gene_type:complete